MSKIFQLLNCMDWLRCPYCHQGTKSVSTIVPAEERNWLYSCPRCGMEVVIRKSDKTAGMFTVESVH